MFLQNHLNQLSHILSLPHATSVFASHEVMISSYNTRLSHFNTCGHLALLISPSSQHLSLLYVAQTGGR